MCNCNLYKAFSRTGPYDIVRTCMQRELYSLPLFHFRPENLATWRSSSSLPFFCSVSVLLVCVWCWPLPGLAACLLVCLALLSHVMVHHQITRGRRRSKVCLLRAMTAAALTQTQTARLPLWWNHSSAYWRETETKVSTLLHWYWSISIPTLVSILSIFGSIRPPLLKTLQALFNDLSTVAVLHWITPWARPPSSPHQKN